MPHAPTPEHTFEACDIAEEAVRTFAWQDDYSTKKARTNADKYGNTGKLWLACAHGDHHRN